MGVTDAERLDERVDAMTHWLRMMLSPDDPAAVLYHLPTDSPRSFEADTQELGDRVADGLHSEWAYRSEDGLAAHLGVLVGRAERDRSERDSRVARQTADLAVAAAEQAAGTQPTEAEPAGDGEFTIDVGMGSMTCGYCGHTASWAQAVLGYWRLTGYHLLGVRLKDGALVVMAEAQTMDGEVIHLPHPCTKIPAGLHAEYADEAARIVADAAAAADGRRAAS